MAAFSIRLYGDPCLYRGFCGVSGWKTFRICLMFQFIRYLILFCFTLWIVPLGAFIAPEKEGKACGGQRAVCLCSHYLKKATAPNAGKQFASAGANSQEQTGYWGQSGHQFILFSFDGIRSSKDSPFVVLSSINLSSSFLRSIEHIPKA